MAIGLRKWEKLCRCGGEKSILCLCGSEKIPHDFTCDTDKVFLGLAQFLLLIAYLDSEYYFGINMGKPIGEIKLMENYSRFISTRIFISGLERKIRKLERKWYQLGGIPRLNESWIILVISWVGSDEFCQSHAIGLSCFMWVNNKTHAT